MFVYVSHSSISYVINNIQFVRGKLEQKLSSSITLEMQTETITRLEEQEIYLRKLHAMLKNTEGVFESSIQAVILVLTLALHFR